MSQEAPSYEGVTGDKADNYNRVCVMWAVTGGNEEVAGSRRQAFHPQRLDGE